jgi:hypothetical protein
MAAMDMAPADRVAGKAADTAPLALRETDMALQVVERVVVQMVALT